jgi:hypothetical protein
MNKKRIFIRCRKVAPKRYLIEQRRKFLWFWEFWQKGSPTLGLKTYYSSKLTAKTAVYSHAEKKNLVPTLIFLTN